VARITKCEKGIYLAQAQELI